MAKLGTASMRNAEISNCDASYSSPVIRNQISSVNTPPSARLCEACNKHGGIHRKSFKKVKLFGLDLVVEMQYHSVDDVGRGRNARLRVTLSKCEDRDIIIPSRDAL